MKKLLSILMTLIFAMSMVTGCSAAEDKSDSFILTMQIGNPVMSVNGVDTEIDPGRGTVPFIQNDRTLVPIRAIIEAMGGSVNWDEETQTAFLHYNGDIITLAIGNRTAYLNETANTLDVAPTVINDRTMLPIRFIAESFKFNVNWNGETQTITITKSDEVTQNTAVQPTERGKVLVVYYSATGSTEKVARYIADETGADIFELEPVNPYTDADLDWTDDNSRVVREHNNENERKVELKETSVTDWESYDTVFIGYPIWWGIASWPVNGFIEANDFTGKTVIPFCTSASSSLGESGKLLAEVAGTGDWDLGMRFRSGVSENDVKTWVESLDIKTDTSKTNSKTLVVYFSQPETDKADNMTQEEDNSTVVINGEVLGNTQYMAYVIAETKNADIFRIEPEIPYPTEHRTLVDQAAREQDNKARPAIKGSLENIDDYDVLFLGYPNWWGDMPMILYTFLEQYDLSGKTVIPFNTHGGSGFSDTIDTIRTLQPSAEVLDGLSISRNHIQDAEDEIVTWINNLDK
ncbi:MAG: flavodoxin [Clostridia bacterium]